MVTQKAKIVSRYGIHVRPASIIYKAMTGFQGVSFSVDAGEGPVAIDGLMSIMALGLECGTNVVIEADGPGADRACEKIAELFSQDFEFER